MKHKITKKKKKSTLASYHKSKRNPNKTEDKHDLKPTWSMVRDGNILKSCEGQNKALHHALKEFNYLG